MRLFRALFQMSRGATPPVRRGCSAISRSGPLRHLAAFLPFPPSNPPNDAGESPPTQKPVLELLFTFFLCRSMGVKRSLPKMISADSVKRYIELLSSISSSTCCHPPSFHRCGKTNAADYRSPQIHRHPTRVFIVLHGF